MSGVGLEFNEADLAADQPSKVKVIRVIAADWHGRREGARPETAFMAENP